MSLDLGHLFRHRRLLDQPTDDCLGGFALARAEEAFENDAVGQDERSQSLHIVWHDELPPFDQGQRLSRAIETECAASAHADRVALRTKGDEFSMTWSEYADRVRDTAGGLAALGLERGQSLAILLTNRPEFHFFDSAALHLGATPFSLYNTYTAEQIQYQVSDAEAGVLVTEEAFATSELEMLIEWLKRQPPWSDLPVLLLTKRNGNAILQANLAASLGNTTILERPFFPGTLVSAARSALRARARQQGVELPLVISDHADWRELTETIAETCAEEVWVTHGREDALLHHIPSTGRKGRALALIGREDEDQ